MNASRRVHKRINREMGPDYPEPQKYAHQLSGLGGQYAPAVGDSTLHHKHQWDFSVALANAGEQLALYWFEQERQKYAGMADVAW